MSVGNGSPRRSRRPWQRPWIRWPLIALAVYFGVCGLLAIGVPPGLQRLALPRAAEAIGRPVTAGRIRFEAHALDGRPDALRFEIHSVARSRDGLVAFAYDTLGGGKLMQEATWVEFCQRVAQASGGQALGPVTVETTRRAADGTVEHTVSHV